MAFENFEILNLSAIYLELFELIWSADRGWWVDNLIKFKKSFYFSGVMALWKFWHFKTCQQDASKIIWARCLKPGQLTVDDE